MLIRKLRMLKKILICLLVSSSIVYASSRPEAVIKVSIDETIYSPEEISDKIVKEKNNPQMIAWYIGESGITKGGAQFYQDEIFNRFKSVKTPHKFHLYDLVAWQGLRNKTSSIASKSKMAEHIDSLNNPHFSSIHSADFLKDIMQEDNESVITYTRDTILRNPHLFIHSAERKETGIKLKEVLPAKSLEPIHHLDTAHTYAALQYLEGIFLTKQIALKDAGNKHNIIFFLPNDEYKYYVSEQIEADMNALVKDKIPADSHIDATFNCFKFGRSIAERPYILHDKKATKQDLSALFK